jgi:hypothetical protein
VQSVIDSFGGERACEGMMRIRIGIGPPAAPTVVLAAKRSGQSKQSKVSARTFESGSNVVAYVMRTSTSEEEIVMREVKHRVEQAIVQILTPMSIPISSADAAAALSPLDGASIDPSAASTTPAAAVPISDPSASSAAVDLHPAYAAASTTQRRCGCAHSIDSSAALAHRLQHTMTRYNGAHVTQHDRGVN